MQFKKVFKSMTSVLLVLSILMSIVPMIVMAEGEDSSFSAITVPNDAELFVGSKPYQEFDYGYGPYIQYTHFVPFDEVQPANSVIDGDNTTYYFDLAVDNTYNYRVSGEDYITYGGTFTNTLNHSIEITEDMLSPDVKTKNTVDRDTSSNGGYNTADIYLNINPQGYLKLSEAGDTYQLVTLRNWEAVDNTSNNYFIEPDYNYIVIDESGNPSDDVVSVSNSGLITAVGEGTAIVLVTYDAINIPTADGGPFFGAIWPENTGVFVVSVGARDSIITANMTVNQDKNTPSTKLSGDLIDTEHDVIYFTGEYGSYTFTPETDNCTVSVANPLVDTEMTFNGFIVVEANNNGGFTVPLKEGRNIVKLEKDGNAEYQVITAKQVTITVNNGEAVHPGDELSIVFDTIYHPAGKLAGVYNMSANIIYETPDEETIGSTAGLYTFASSSASQTINNYISREEIPNDWGYSDISYTLGDTLRIPDDWSKDSYTLVGGCILAHGWGDHYGNHRGITLTDGKAPNLDSNYREGFLGVLPDIEIPISAPEGELQSITLDTTDVKTDYYIGDAFDAANLIVTANYDSGKTQIVTNYTVTPEIIANDTTNVTVTYRGKTADIPVSVNPIEVTNISITTPPFKTSYKEGDTFDPTGMVVTATYNNGKVAVINDYNYSPNRELTTADTKVTITYTDEELTAETPITVSELSSGGAVSNNITVKFTLYGDDNHGDSSQKHTLKAGNLETWISTTSVTVPKGSYIIDVVSKALSIAGIPYSNPSGDYIESIKGLSEQDNGSTSGWMYTLNGSYPTKSITEQTVKNGDRIVFHYTDDHTQEKSSDGWSGSSSSNIVIDKDEQVENEKPSDEQNETENLVFSEKTFNDIKADAWYYESVKYVYENNLMQGTGEVFEPESNMTRAMLVTVLYRLANPQSTTGINPFEDIEDGAWYSDAVKWAAENNIVNGLSSTHFAPDDNVTREQMAVIIYRYLQHIGYDTEKRSDLSYFEDSSQISDWAIDAVMWAKSVELINGTSETLLAPAENATRAQVATILMRLCENILK